MKAVDIDLARGIDGSIDPRVAPNGTLARVQNLRLDKTGRMVLRNGYQSLGTTVHDGGTQLVPFDLHETNGSLVCLGNHSPTNHTGIRAPYVYEPFTSKGAWRTTSFNSLADNAVKFIGICPADAPRIVYSQARGNVASASSAIASDVAAIGSTICVATTQSFAGGLYTYVEIVSADDGNTIHEAQLGLINCRVVACGNVLVIVGQVQGTGQMQAATFDVTTSTVLSATTALSTFTANNPFDVQELALGTTEYLVVFATGTGYTWERRLVSTHAVQATRSEVALANCAVSICGAAGETVNVLAQRAVTGFELRTYALAGGAPTVGPTNLDAAGLVYGWVALQRYSSTQVYAIANQTTVSTDLTCRLVTTATHAFTSEIILSESRTTHKPVIVDSLPFVWSALGPETQRPYGLLALSIGAASFSMELAAIALNGEAKTTYAAAPAIAYVQHMARGSGRKLYAALIARDPRDGSFRTHVVETEVFSGARRQGVTLGQNLYLAGGALTQFDGQFALEVGFETAPAIAASTIAQSGGGALTALGVYQFFLVWRSVSRNGEVTQSAPSSVTTITMTGANTRLDFNANSPYSRRHSRLARFWTTTVYLDVYRTEAGGSIPRLSQTIEMNPPTISLGGPVAVVETNSDVAIQSGAKLYTQGSDGAVSGRLPLGIAGPCRNVAASEGKLWLAGLERRGQYRLSVENRPGEAAGFVNDDLFFGENSEDITALAIGTDGRRFVFGRTTVREVRGEGPNAAGIGELSEPLEVDGQVGAVDWRGVVKCEHGVLFRASDSKIYLLPIGGGAAISAAESIQDVLALYPVTTGAVRHDDDQLVTFSVTNAAGTDGRLVHLDLQQSGMGRNGWVSRWIVDRMALLEDVPGIEVVSESLQTFEGLPLSLTVALPTVQTGDRLLVLLSASGTASGQSATSPTSGWGQTLQVISATGYVGAFERITSSAATTMAITLTQAASCIVRVLQLRGAHASQPAEATGVTANASTSANVGNLTPSWGSAKNLWLAACTAAGTDTTPPPFLTVPLFTVYPAGFGAQHADRLPFAGLLGCEQATCRQSLAAASLDPSAFTVSGATDLSALMLAVRPAGTAGTPVRAPVQFERRLVVCNSTDVYRSTVGSFADQGNAYIVAETETATIYPMGPGGAGRHLSIVFVGEFRGRCLLAAELSYDDGLTWTSLTPHTLNANQYTAGQTVRVSWTPRRRKVEGVRARFRALEDAGSGPSEGLVFQRAVFYFEDLLGAPRLPALQRK